MNIQVRILGGRLGASQSLCPGFRRDREGMLAQAEENLARVKDEVDPRIQTIYNKRERTRETLWFQKNSWRCEPRGTASPYSNLNRGQRFLRKSTPRPHKNSTLTALLQSQLEYLEAEDEMSEAEGIAPQTVLFPVKKDSKCSRAFTLS
jgi:hypothetical protein